MLVAQNFESFIFYQINSVKSLRIDADAGEVKSDLRAPLIRLLKQFVMSLQPPMSDSRRAIVEQAFRKLDKTGDGVITVEDIRGVYSVTAHPR